MWFIMLFPGFIVHIIPFSNFIIPFATNLTSLIWYISEWSKLFSKKIKCGTILYPSGIDWIVKSEHYSPEQRQVDGWEGLKSKSVLWSHYRGTRSFDTNTCIFLSFEIMCINIPKFWFHVAVKYPNTGLLILHRALQAMM